MNSSMLIPLNLNKPLANFRDEVAHHQIRLRAVLRSLEDGSFGSRALEGRPGAVLQFQFMSTSTLLEESAAKACNECFVAMVRSCLTFVDRLLAIRAVMARQLTIPSTITTFQELDDYVGTILDESYQTIARDHSLKNPTKISQFDRLDSFERDTALEYISLRACLEHHAGLPRKQLTIQYYRPYLAAGAIEITRLGEPLPPNTAMSLTAEVPKRVFEPGVGVTLAEHEIENIGFTLQWVIGPSFIKATPPAINDAA